MGALAAMLCIGAAVALLRHSAAGPRAPGEQPGQHTASEDGTADSEGTPVTTVHPRRDPSFAIAVREPAYVEPFFRAHLEARVAGPVRFVRKDVGDRVVTGEPLLQIDVPDVEEDVAQKDAIVRQREIDLAVAEVHVGVAVAALATAESNVRSREAEVQSAEANRNFRRKELERFLGLRQDRAVTGDVVDERALYYQSAEAALSAASAAVQRARAEVQEAQAKLASVRADVRLKQSLIDVARKDRDRAQALLSYATLTAPFDGVVTQRAVDPGSFVQNGTTGRTGPLLTVERTDIVTVYAKIPDPYAPYISRDTEALIEMTELPGQLIHGKVTRFAPSLNASDRTMRVEVDLFNGGPAAYRRFTARAVADFLAPLGTTDTQGATTLLLASRETWRVNNMRGAADPFPLRPRFTGQARSARPGRLFPGMYGKMQLQLREFHGAFLVPRDAIISQGGKPFVVEARQGRAHFLPVDVEVEDARRAKVSVLVREGNEELRRELTGQEQIVVGSPGELADGQPVVASVREDW